MDQSVSSWIYIYIDEKVNDADALKKSRLNVVMAPKGRSECGNQKYRQAAPSLEKTMTF